MRHTAQPLALALGAALLLAPFAGKAVHVDDPLFLWAAEAIRAHPLDFHGARVNWYGTEDNLWRIAQNPPGWSYAIAAVSTVLGDVVAAARVLAVAAAVAAVLGVWRLARGLTAAPFLAALFVLVSPAFFVSATTLMCDVPMLAAFVWALVCWREGLEERRATKLALAALLASAAILTKYSAVIVVPIAVLDLVLRARVARPPRSSWLFALAPLVVLAAFEAATATLYGRGLFAQAAAYASAERAASQLEPAAEIVVALAFLGGSAAIALFPGVLALPRRWAVVIAFAALVTTAALVRTHPPRMPWLFHEHGVRASYAAQMWLWTSAGGLAVAIVVRACLVRVAERRAPARGAARDTVVLATWFALAFAFGALVNWTVNARSLLLALPPLAILLARAIERERRFATTMRVACALAPAACLSLAVAIADAEAGNTNRAAALSIAGEARNAKARLYFQGHWGFQWYMEREGAHALDFVRFELLPGDLVAVPYRGTNVRSLPQGVCEMAATFEKRSTLPLATLDDLRGAGFHARSFGALPFVFGASPVARFDVVRVTRAFSAPR